MSNPKKKKILLVEDDPLIIKIYSSRLEQDGFEVEVASRGNEVIRKLKEQKYDLVLLDLVLPELTGFEILEKIRKEKEFSDLKVLVLSNLGEKENISKANRFGVVDYLVKARYTPREVVEEVNRVLKN